MTTNIKTGPAIDRRDGGHDWGLPRKVCGRGDRRDAHSTDDAERGTKHKTAPVIYGSSDNIRPYPDGAEGIGAPDGSIHLNSSTCCSSATVVKFRRPLGPRYWQCGWGRRGAISVWA